MPSVWSSPARTCDVAILCGGAVGVAAIFSDRFVSVAGQSLTASIVTLSVFGAIVMYIISMASLFRLRRSEPGLDRPFAAPFFPWFPGFAMVAAVICLVTMGYFNPLMATLFVSLGVVGYLYFLATATRRRAAAALS